MDKKVDIKKISSILASLEQELGGEIPQEYLIDGLCKEFGWFDEDTMKKIIEELKKIRLSNSKTK